MLPSGIVNQTEPRSGLTGRWLPKKATRSQAVERGLTDSLALRSTRAKGLNKHAGSAGGLPVQEDTAATWHVQVAVAISVEALVFIVIGCSCSEGCEFDSH